MNSTNKHIVITNFNYKNDLFNYDLVEEVTMNTYDIKLYNDLPKNIKVLNIELLMLQNYNIVIDNLPLSLEKIRLIDYSKYTEFEFLENDTTVICLPIEIRRRKNMLNIINKYIKKLPFGCILTNRFDERLIEFL